MQIHMVQDFGMSCVGETDIINVHSPLRDVKLNCSRLLNNGRLEGHQVAEPAKSGHTAGKDLGELGHLADRRDEGADEQREGDQVNVVHFPFHDQIAADSDHDRRKDPHEEFLRRAEDPHCLVEFFLGSPVCGIRPGESAVILLLICEGLGSLHSGQTGFDVGVDIRQPGLDIGRRL